MPRAALSSRASDKNGRATTATAGTPSFSTSIVSWIHHEVHDPQSARAHTEAFAHSPTEANAWRGAGPVGRVFWKNRTSAPFCAQSWATALRNMFAPGLQL